MGGGLCGWEVFRVGHRLYAFIAIFADIIALAIAYNKVPFARWFLSIEGTVGTKWMFIYWMVLSHSTDRHVHQLASR